MQLAVALTQRGLEAGMLRCLAKVLPVVCSLHLQDLDRWRILDFPIEVSHKNWRLCTWFMSQLLRSVRIDVRWPASPSGLRRGAAYEVLIQTVFAVGLLVLLRFLAPLAFGQFQLWPVLALR